jgi:putative ABC transport system permease protein
MAGYGMTFNIGGQKADTKVLVTGQNFFTFFDYRLLTGDRRKVLSAPNQIVVGHRARRQSADSIFPELARRHRESCQ